MRLTPDLLSSITTPLIAAGLAMILIWAVVEKLPTARAPTISGTHWFKIVQQMVDRLFWLALVALVFGFLGYALNLYLSKAIQDKVRTVTTTRPSSPPGQSVGWDGPRKYKYRFQDGAKNREGFFEFSASQGLWLEYTSASWIPTYVFTEHSIVGDELMIYDSSRGYYLRLPIQEGWASLSRSPDSDFQNLHHVEPVR